MNASLTLIIPAKAESESLPHTLLSLRNDFQGRVIISLEKTDTKTISCLKGFENVTIVEQTGKGYGNAITEGIAHCTTPFFCTFMADGSFPSEELKSMYEVCQTYDFVFGSRYQGKESGSEDDSMLTYIGNQIFSMLGKVCFSLKISDVLYTFIMGRTSAFLDLDIQEQHFNFCVEVPIKIERFKLKYCSVPSKERKRIAGKKKVQVFKDGFNLLMGMIKLFLNPPSQPSKEL